MTKPLGLTGLVEAMPWRIGYNAAGRVVVAGIAAGSRKGDPHGHRDDSATTTSLVEDQVDTEIGVYAVATCQMCFTDVEVRVLADDPETVNLDRAVCEDCNNLF